MNRFFVILIFVLMSLNLRAEKPFGDNEELCFIASYRAKLFPTTDVAEIKVTMKKNGNRYEIVGVGRTMQFFKWFFDMHDVYRTTLDANTLRPIRSSKDIKEGKYQYKSSHVYDWRSKQAHVTYGNLKRPEPLKKSITITEEVADAVALFYNLRSKKESDLKIGQDVPLNLLLDDTIKVIKYRYWGKEVKNISGMGRYKTLKFSCQLAPDNESARYEDGSVFYLWISDDENHVPLYIESPVRVGSVRVRLDSYSGLKAPLNCKVK